MLTPSSSHQLAKHFHTRLVCPSAVLGGTAWREDFSLNPCSLLSTTKSSVCRGFEESSPLEPGQLLAANLTLKSPKGQEKPGESCTRAVSCAHLSVCT